MAYDSVDIYDGNAPSFIFFVPNTEGCSYPDFYFSPGKLFSIEQKVSLRIGKVSEGLLKEFQKRGYPLTKNKAKISQVKKGWLITDQSNHYTMKKTAKGLDIYWKKEIGTAPDVPEGIWGIYLRLFHMIVAYITKDKRPLVYKNSGIRTISEWWKTIVYVSVFYLAFTTILVEGYQIPSGSMEPTFHGEMSWRGDRIFAMKNLFRLWDLKRGEIIIFISVEDHKTFIVKRLVALPGEKVEIRKGKVYINNKKLTGKPFDDIVYASDLFDEIIYLPHKVHSSTLQQLIIELNDSHNPVSQYLLRRFSGSMRRKIFKIQRKLNYYASVVRDKKLLENAIAEISLKKKLFDGTKEIWVEIKKLEIIIEELKPEILKFTKKLGKELQKVFDGKLIYNKNLFKNFDLSPSVQKLLQEKKINTSELNQILLREVYVHKQYNYGVLGKSFVVPKDCYFVLGDNTTNSNDGRVWGWVSKRKLLGKALLIWFPWYRLKILGQ